MTMSAVGKLSFAVEEFSEREWFWCGRRVAPENRFKSTINMLRLFQKPTSLFLNSGSGGMRLKERRRARSVILLFRQ
jgi:hypothetical protein